jgi:hypothetical protein
MKPIFPYDGMTLGHDGYVMGSRMSRHRRPSRPHCPSTPEDGSIIQFHRGETGVVERNVGSPRMALALFVRRSVDRGAGHVAATEPLSH